MELDILIDAVGYPYLPISSDQSVGVLSIAADKKIKVKRDSLVVIIFSYLLSSCT